jgi:DNA-binding SARP family transcriptional activator
LHVEGTDDEDVALPGAGPRVVLAVLLVHANRPVPVDTLVEAVWRGQPPRSWASNIQTYVSRLRHALPGIDVRYTDGAYRLHLDPSALDLTEFWTDVDAGRKCLAEGDHARAVVRFRAALGRWRGEPLADVPVPALAPELRRLAEERLTVTEECLDAELAAGRHADLLGELRTLVAGHPARDRLRAQLMLALARSGRARDALAVYLEAPGEPGPELRRLHAAVQRGEVTVPRPVAVRTPFPVCLLPPDVPNLTGRGALVADLLAHLGHGGTAPPLVAVDGRPGVGKTAFVVHLAHRARAGFPDGQLYGDLAGGSRHPRDPLDVLAEWLHALGLTGTAIPAGLEARAAAYRARLADRRVLVVLDNAADPAQVRPLLPGTPGSAVVVTSRTRLPGLTPTAARTLVPLRGTESRALLAAALGHARVAAERAAADRIAAACGHLPLALRIAAAGRDDRLTPLADRLDALASPESPVRAGIALRYAALDPAARRALRRLALLGPLDTAGWAIAALLDQPECDALIGRLVEAGLLDPAGRDAAGQPRFRLHELIRGYARERASDDDESPDTVLGRLTGRATALVGLATAALPHPVTMPRLHPPTEPADLPAHLVERVTRDPLGWLSAERPAFVVSAMRACRHGRYRDAALLLDRLVGYLIAENRTADLSRIACAVRDSADAAGDGRTATWARVVLGRSTGDAGLATLRRAVADSERGGHQDLLAWALLGLSGYERSAGPDSVGETPLDAARRAAAHFAELGDAAGHTQALRAAALALLILGRSREAEQTAAEGVRLARELGDPLHLANLLSTYGTVLLALREPHRARRAAHGALRLLRAVDAQQAVCYVLGQLGRVNATLGERAQAQRHLAEARAIALVLDDPIQATLLLRDIAASWLGDGHADEAVPVLRRCVRTLVELGQRRRAAVTQRVLATSYDALGDGVGAAAATADAETLAGPLDEPAGEQLRQVLLLTR